MTVNAESMERQPRASRSALRAPAPLSYDPHNIWRVVDQKRDLFVENLASFRLKIYYFLYLLKYIAKRFFFLFFVIRKSLRG